MSRARAMLRLREEDVAFREFDGEGILLDLRASTYLAVNPSATVLWRKLGEGTTRDDLIRALVEQYGIAEAQAAGDVDAFLAECRERDLVREEGEER